MKNTIRILLLATILILSLLTGCVDDEFKDISKEDKEFYSDVYKVYKYMENGKDVINDKKLKNICDEILYVKYKDVTGEKAEIIYDLDGTLSLFSLRFDKNFDVKDRESTIEIGNNLINKFREKYDFID